MSITPVPKVTNHKLFPDFRPISGPSVLTAQTDERERQTERGETWRDWR